MKANGIRIRGIVQKNRGKGKAFTERSCHNKQ